MKEVDYIKTPDDNWHNFYCRLATFGIFGYIAVTIAIGCLLGLGIYLTISLLGY